jgi:hypothetical protein
VLDSVDITEAPTTVSYLDSTKEQRQRQRDDFDNGKRGERCT